MAALRDPKLEKFAQALFGNLVAGMKRSAAAAAAAEVAGFRGSSLKANARKRAQRADVKRRLAELGQPIADKMQAQLAATVEWATARLASIAEPDLGVDATKVSDQIAAIRTLAQINGWLAPEKHDLTHRTPVEQLSDHELSDIAAGGGQRAAQAPVDP